MHIAYAVSIWLLPVLIAITSHEAAHGYVAWKLGDDTAKRLGRVTFNPLRHVDPFGTVIVPGILLATTGFVFGWAKPVPVDFSRLDNPKRDMVWVGAAGPGINLILAVASALLIHLALLAPPWLQDWMIANLQNSILINLVLAVFNMIPLPPLDGGRVAVGLLPHRIADPLARMERFGLLVIIAALFILPLAGRELGMNLNVFPWLVGTPVAFLWDVLATMTGLK